MKIILRVYNEMRLGNLSTMSIEIPNNKITVKELKNKIYYKYKIKPSEQRLTYRICHKKLITLTDIYPLNFFFIKEYSMIFIEIISNEEKNEKIDNVAHKKYNTIKIKYMNMLGYYMPDAKTFQRNQNSNSNAFVKKNSYSSKELRLFTFPSSNYTNSAINSDDDCDDLCLVSDNKYKKELYKKSIKSNNINEENFRENDINNAKIIKDLFSLDIVEKLSIIIRQNDFKKLKSLLFQYNTYLNKDKDISYYNNNLEKDKKKYAISQVNTNYKTSFNTEYTSNSLLINNNICEALDKNGWNSIHYSSYFGYYEILDYIINKFNTKSNINIINNEGWNALSLAVYKQQIQCVELLMTYDGIDVNYNGPMGTALHIACKKNNRQIVSLLLYKADITIKDKNKKIALEYTQDKNIIKLISKIVINKLNKLDKNSDLYKNLYNFIDKYKHLLITKNIQKKEIIKNNNITKKKNYSFLNELNNMPQKPPFLFGEIEKIGGIFNTSKKFYIEINPINGLLRLFKTFEDYPRNPNEIINIIDINKCFIADDQFNYKNNYYFFIEYKFNKGNSNEFINNSIQNNSINNNGKIISLKLLVHSSEICNNLVIVINNIIRFHEYWNSTIKNLRDKKEEIIDYLNTEKFYTLKFNFDTNNFILLDDKGNEIKINPTIFEQNKSINQNNLGLEKKINLDKNNNNNIVKVEKPIENKISYKSFEVLEIIGSGSFGKVFKVRLKSTNEIFAMKVLNKSFLLKKKLLRYAITECNILKESNCPFIIKLHYSFQTPDNLYMILDYCSIGDLGSRIYYELLEEDEAKFYIAELILAIEYLHQHDIIYRDLKPENILIDSDGHIKLTDFDLAKENVKNNIPNKTFCGSPLYLSPEMLSKEGATKASDIYGIGVILYQMVYGDPPFYKKDQKLMFKNILEGNLEFPELFSDELKDLLKKMLNKNPKKRLGINNDKSDLKNHPFFEDINWDDIAKKKINPPVDIIDLRKEYNLDQKVEFIDVDYTSENYNIRRVPNFSFIKSE